MTDFENDIDRYSLEFAQATDTVIAGLSVLHDLLESRDAKPVRRQAIKITLTVLHQYRAWLNPPSRH